MSSQDPLPKARLFQQALQVILRPLTRALIAQGVTAPALYKIVKQSYVDVAVDALGADTTDSRVSIMTGIHRRDVKAMRDARDDTDAPLQRKLSTLATVVGRWMSDPSLTQPDGKPMPLTRSTSGPDDTRPSFDALVEHISRDIRPKTVLDELTRQGIVRLEDGMVHLYPEAVIGPDDLDQKLHFFARNLGDHMEAAVGNLLEDAAPSFERAAFFNALKAGSIDDLETDAREIGMQALRRIAAQASAHQDSDRDAEDATHRFRFGIYFYREDEAAPKGKPAHRDKER